MNPVVSIVIAFIALCAGFSIGVSIENHRIANLYRAGGLCGDDSRVWAPRTGGVCWSADR